MNAFNEYTINIEKGIESSKAAAKELLQVLERPIESSQEKIKMAVETKRLTATDYFHILKTIKTQTDRLIVTLEERNYLQKARETKDVFEYLTDAYEKGFQAIEHGLDDLLVAMEQKIDSEKKLTSDKLKSISSSKKIAADDYFFLIDFLELKKEEKKTLKLVERPEDKSVEIVEAVEEKIGGYAERYAN